MMMVNSYYKCEFGNRRVVVWPSLTNESGFYDVVLSDVDDESTARTVCRLTAFESAAYVLTELGVPLGETVCRVEGMIRRWRADLDSQVDEPSYNGNRTVTDDSGKPVSPDNPLYDWFAGRSVVAS